MLSIHSIITKALIGGVNFYRKFISPYKGFHCAHSHYASTLSCSTYGLKVLKENSSPIEALRLIFHRLNACSHIHSLYKPCKKPLSKLQKSQGGFVDGCDCGGCDMPDCKGCDLPSCKGIGMADMCSCDVSPCNTKAAANSSSRNCWEAFYIVEGCSSCDPFYKANSTSQPTLDKSTKNPDSLIIPNFQLIDQLEDGYLLYKYNLTDSYYKIHKSCINCAEKDILSLKTPEKTWELNAEDVKKIFKMKKG